jgi:hypothetical protein
MEPHLWALLHKDGGSNRRRRREKKDRGSSSNKPSYRFVDKIRVRVVGGEGGRGSLSAESLVRRKMRPDGGHGGNGGSVILLADPNEQTLHLNRPVLRAEKGANGSGKQKHGRNGRNRIIRVPCGVVVRKISSPHDDHLYGYDGYDEDFMEDFEIEGEEYDDEEFTSTTMTMMIFLSRVTTYRRRTTVSLRRVVVWKMTLTIIPEKKAKQGTWLILISLGLMS